MFKYTKTDEEKPPKSKMFQKEITELESKNSALEKQAEILSESNKNLNKTVTALQTDLSRLKTLAKEQTKADLLFNSLKLAGLIPDAGESEDEYLRLKDQLKEINAIKARSFHPFPGGFNIQQYEALR